QLFGSYFLYYHGGFNPPSLTCGGVACSPPPTGPGSLNFPSAGDVEGADAIVIQSPRSAFNFLGTDTGGAVSLSFGTSTSADYAALPRTLATDFAVPGAPLFAGPRFFPPGINFDSVSATELETNIILLNLNYTQFLANGAAVMSVNSWNWFETGFT